MIFNLTITATNAWGILLTIAGGAWYAWLEMEEKKKAALAVARFGSNSDLSNVKVDHSAKR
jgi:hypothetical protein